MPMIPNARMINQGPSSPLAMLLAGLGQRRSPQLGGSLSAVLRGRPMLSAQDDDEDDLDPFSFPAPQPAPRPDGPGSPWTPIPPWTPIRQSRPMRRPMPGRSRLVA